MQCTAGLTPENVPPHWQQDPYLTSLMLTLLRVILGLNPHLRRKEADSFRSVYRVREMGGGDNQSAGADQVTDGTIDLHFILGEIGDLLIVLAVAGITEQDDALDHVLDAAVETADSVVHHCCSLAIFFHKIVSHFIPVYRSND